jgi:predicted nucleic acid-binding Zn ribbon protein
MSLKSLPQLLNSISNQESWRGRRQFQTLLVCWSELVGPAVAAQTRPTSLQRQVLQVATSSSAWAQNLAFERHTILKKVNARLALDLTDIRFSTGHWQSHWSPNHQGLQQIGNSVENDSEVAILWRDHPSRVPHLASPRRSGAPPDLPHDPQAAFLRWARSVRVQAQHLPLCPTCQSPTPEGELNRWSVCAHCAAKRFAAASSWGYAQPPPEPLTEPLTGPLPHSSTHPPIYPSTQ